MCLPWLLFHTKGLQMLDPISQKLYISLDVTFFEHTPYYLLQGESVSEGRLPLTLDYLDVAMFESPPCLISTPSPNTEGHLNSGGDTEIQINRETLVYLRRPKSKSNEALTSEALKELGPVIVPTPQEFGSNPDQFDIKNAFLNGELEEKVFMTLLPGFCKEEEETKVCKLKKYLYGLKQSPRAWFDRFAKDAILIVYVDDIILIGDNIGEVERLKKVLATEFEPSDALI
ncbi:Retrovirus-related Pol polyprotein from transposon TNT 1-94 [Vitis vinifera]|uniref:Retrovirus-related Pol polyprotein from transposon TNT 1-94 n=1 Tax=Vitis vinifera TaxID=29760 RepID=A0A438EL96_VITVI|nr:Retrovirus-related Pol polyprotein from transposon TNT 1-94 [Vitis vinifera]